MKHKFIFILSLFSLSAISCRDNHPDGHWHLTKKHILIKEDSISANAANNGYEQEAILDIAADTGLWNKNVYTFGGIPLYVNKRSQTIEISNGECFLLNFSYDLRSDTLILHDLNNSSIVYQGIKCENGCCDKQSDEFLEVNVKIDLPVEKDTTQSTFYSIYRPYEQRIYIGPAKVNYDECFPGPRVSVNGKYVTLEDIPIIIEMNKVRIPFSSRNQIRYSLYSDKEVKLRYIVDLVQKFKQQGISNFNLATREDTNLNNEFKLRLRKLPLKEMGDAPEEMTLSEFLQI